MDQAIRLQLRRHGTQAHDAAWNPPPARWPRMSASRVGGCRGAQGPCSPARFELFARDGTESRRDPFPKRAEFVLKKAFNLLRFSRSGGLRKQREPEATD